MAPNELSIKELDDLASYISLAEHYDVLRQLLEPAVAHCWDHTEGVVALSKSFGFVLRAITVNGAFISESEARALMTEWYLKKKSAEVLVTEVYMKLLNETSTAKKENSDGL